MWPRLNLVRLQQPQQDQNPDGLVNVGTRRAVSPPVKKQKTLRGASFFAHGTKQDFVERNVALNAQHAVRCRLLTALSRQEVLLLSSVGSASPAPTTESLGCAPVRPRLSLKQAATTWLRYCKREKKRRWKKIHSRVTPTCPLLLAYLGATVLSWEDEYRRKLTMTSRPLDRNISRQGKVGVGWGEVGSRRLLRGLMTNRLLG